SPFSALSPSSFPSGTLPSPEEELIENTATETLINDEGSLESVKPDAVPAILRQDYVGNQWLPCSYVN
ncbi:MAG: hypothetical protein NZ703_07910, partial [Gemmataceae bacterium]|nr:hypothetical protein [Gemmataceae bacterium]